jgi:predicted RNA-binding protein YlxR (DUF448 family)
VGDDGELVIDRRRVLGGRGVHLCADPACAATARRRGALGRRLRREVRLPADLEGLLGAEPGATT